MPMPDGTMSSPENSGQKPQLIINARGTIKDVSIPVPEAPVLPPVVAGAVEKAGDKAVTAAAAAIGGGLITQLIDHTVEAIEDKDSMERVKSEIHSHDEDYKDDKYRDLTYGELRARLTTSKDNTEKIGLRASERIRLREAASYGVLVDADNELSERLVEADKSDYPAKIAAAAKKAEQRAKESFLYRYNPRIEGVVSSAVGETTVLVKNDLVGNLSDRTRRVVLWDPGLEYATLVNSETAQQKSERLALEKEERDRAHERGMQQQQLDTARELADRQANLAPDAGRMNMTITREHAVGGDNSIFDDDFVSTHGLPVEIFSRPMEIGATKVQGIKTATLLGQVFSSGTVMPEFSWENIRYTIEGDYQNDPVGREKALRKAFSAFNELQNGIFPLMMARWSTKEGSLASLGGRDLQGGALNKGKGTIDMSETIPAFAKDEKAKRALAILLAADGYWVQGMPLPDKALADEFAPRFKDLLVNAEHDKGWSKVRKTAGYTQADCVEYMDKEVAGRIASHLGCDLGRVDLMVMFYTALGGSQRVIDYRELYQRFPVLRTADPRRYNAEKKKWEGDVFMSPLLHKLKLGNDREDRQGDALGDGDLSFGYVERQLSTKGINGLFEALTVKPGLRDGHDIGKYVAGLDVVFSAMKKVEDIQKGDDSYTSAIDRRKKIAELVDGFAQGDPPQFSPKTLEAIKNLPVYSGIGKLAEAGNRPPELVAQDVDMIVDKLGLRGIARGIEAGAGWLRKKIRS